MYSVLTKIRYKKQNWMQGQHNGKMVDLFNWPKFRLTKSVFFRARAVNRGTHVYPRMSKGYLQPLVIIIFIFFIFGVTFVHANLCHPANFYNYSKKDLQRKTIFFFLRLVRESNSRPLDLQSNALSTRLQRHALIFNCKN